ncbi:hypothetical protein TK5_02380 [Sideroxyarcus sp. TK5]
MTATASLLDQHPDTLLSTRQVAPLLRRTYDTLRNDITRAADRVPAVTRVGRSISFRVGDVKSFLEARRTPTPAPLRTRVRKELAAK